MKNVLISLLLVIGCLFSPFIKAQNKSITEPTFESIIQYIEDTKIPFVERFNYSSSTHTLTTKEQIKIDNKLLEYVGEDMAKRIELYCSLFNSYSLLNNQDSAKIYLDAAIKYKNNTDDTAALGALYFQLGNYDLSLNNETTAHENFYKAIAYYETIPNRQEVILQILYKIAFPYARKSDETSLKNIGDKMLLLTSQVNTPEAFLLTYPVIGIYYRVRYNNLPLDDDVNDVIYLDSVYYFDQKTVDAYEQADSIIQKKYSSKASMYYFNVIDASSIRPNPNWKVIQEYVDKGLAILNPTDTVNLGKAYQTKGRALLNQKKYNEAISEALIGLAIIEQYSNEHLGGKFDFYSLLSEIYEFKGDYRGAFKYEQLRSETIKRLNEIEQYETIKEIETKYETSQKDLRIIQLNEKHQKNIFNRTLIVGGFVILTILLLLLLLYNRAKGLRKEKEYLELQNEIEHNKQVEFIRGLESERSRLAKELHDGVSNDLVAIKMMLNANSDKKEIIATLTGVHDNVRNTSHALMSPIFRETTFTDVLIDYVIQYQQITEININLILNPEEGWYKVNHKISNELYRIVQESVANAMKHADAKSITIEGILKNDILTLKIIDDGKGFDVSRKHSGIGIKVIKDRASHIGAKLEITSSEEGTIVKLVLDI